MCDFQENIWVIVASAIIKKEFSSPNKNPRRSSSEEIQETILQKSVETSQEIQLNPIEIQEFANGETSQEIPLDPAEILKEFANGEKSHHEIPRDPVEILKESDTLPIETSREILRDSMGNSERVSSKKICRHPGCGKPTNGKRRGLSCLLHYGNSYCFHPNCFKTANYGPEGKKVFCVAHKGENDISKNNCKYPGCKTIASFGTMDNKRLHCQRHKSKDQKRFF